MMRSRLSVARGFESLPITPLRASGDVPWSISAGAALIEMTQPGLSYSPPSRSSRLSRAASVSRSRGAGSSTATPGGTASPGSRSELRRLLEADVLGFPPRVAAAACEAIFFSRRATSPSNSAIRAPADLPARFVSRLLARNVALARSSFSTCARNSSLLSFGARGSAAGPGFGAAAALAGFDVRRFTAGFAEAVGGRPGLRAVAVRWPALADLAVRAMLSSPLNGLEGLPCWQGSGFLENLVPPNITGKSPVGSDLRHAAARGRLTCPSPFAQHPCPGHPRLFAGWAAHPAPRRDRAYAPSRSPWPGLSGAPRISVPPSGSRAAG